MEAYVELVNRLAAVKSGDIINNSTPEHTVALFTAMFNHGNGEARVFSGGLNPLIYARPKVINAVTNFLSRNGNKLSVIIQGLDGSCNESVTDQDIQRNPLVTALKERLTSTLDAKFSVRRATGAAKDISFHFTMLDTAFRFEPDRNSKEAFACFNRKAMVEILNPFWELALKESSAVALH